MKKTLFLIILAGYFLVVGCSMETETSKVPNFKGNIVKFPEAPLTLPVGSSSEANARNEEGISHYKEGHYELALKHFREAKKIQSGSGEISFNIALALDKLGDHGGAKLNFRMAERLSRGNALITESKILLDHIQ